MGQNLREKEQYLLEIVANFLAEMSDLAVRLAEAAQTMHSEEGQRRPINSKVVDPFAGTQLRI